jgi:hypothetical protein
LHNSQHSKKLVVTAKPVVTSRLTVTVAFTAKTLTSRARAGEERCDMNQDDLDRRAFVDALRECLGLGPLYASDAPSEYRHEQTLAMYRSNGQVEKKPCAK